MAEPLKDIHAWRAVKAIAEHGSATEAAKALNLPRSTLRHHAETAERRGITAESPAPVETPDFPASDIPFEKRKELQRESFEARQESYRAHRWFTLDHADDLPCGYAFIGDTHLGSDGFNSPEFDKHMELLSRAEAVSVVHIGDLSDLWPSGGRLAGKYADSSFRRKDEIDAIRHMLDLHVPWKVVLLGNHDMWSSDTEEIVREIARDKDIIIHKWQADFIATFPNGRKCFIKTSHNFKGHSMYHNTHGAIRSFQESPAHVLVCGHTHSSGYMWRPAAQVSHLFNDGISFISHLVRVCGYKKLDTYALTHGFHEEEDGASCFAVIDPKSKTGDGFIRMFMDIEAGCDYLKALRSKRKREQKRDAD